MSYDDHFINENKLPLSRTFRLKTDQSATAAVKAARGMFAERNAKVQSVSPTRLQAVEGSRFAFRIWGATANRGYNNLPLTAAIDVTDDANGRGSDVIVTLTSNEGWYPLGRAEIGNRAYLQRFHAIELRLTALLGGSV